jgi:hypothetical protein
MRRALTAAVRLQVCRAGARHGWAGDFEVEGFCERVLDI